MANYLLQENGDRLLQENGDGILLDFAVIPSRLTQVATLYLYAEASPARLTQAATLVLYEESAPARVTQITSLVLVEDIPEARVTQTPILVLHDQIPCVQKWAQCWKITRRDGVVLGFTGCDQTVSFGGVDYIPCGSLMSSAMQYSAAIGEAGNQELLGLIDSDLITARDLAAGLYQGAEVEIWLYPYENTTGQTMIRASSGYVTSTSQGDVGYKAEVMTDGQRLMQTAVTNRYTPSCRWEFGDARCGINPGIYEETATVTETVDKLARIGASRRQFVTTLAAADGDYIAGKITWLTGPNAGQIIDVKDNQGGLVTLWDTTIADIQVGDEFKLNRGCQRTAEACKGYDNYINFGGFPSIPGRDSMLETPDAKG